MSWCHNLELYLSPLVDRWWLPERPPSSCLYNFSFLKFFKKTKRHLWYWKGLHWGGHRGLLPTLDAVPDQESRNGESANNDDHPDQLPQLLTLAANMLETMDGRSFKKLPEEPSHRAHDGWPLASGGQSTWTVEKSFKANFLNMEANHVIPFNKNWTFRSRRALEVHFRRWVPMKYTLPTNKY